MDPFTMFGVLIVLVVAFFAWAIKKGKSVGLNMNRLFRRRTPSAPPAGAGAIPPVAAGGYGGGAPMPANVLQRRTTMRWVAIIIGIALFGYWVTLGMQQQAAIQIAKAQRIEQVASPTVAKPTLQEVFPTGRIEDALVIPDGEMNSVEIPDDESWSRLVEIPEKRRFSFAEVPKGKLVGTPDRTRCRFWYNGKWDVEDSWALDNHSYRRDALEKRYVSFRKPTGSGVSFTNKRAYVTIILPEGTPQKKAAVVQPVPKEEKPKPVESKVVPPPKAEQKAQEAPKLEAPKAAEKPTSATPVVKPAEKVRTQRVVIGSGLERGSIPPDDVRDAPVVKRDADGTIRVIEPSSEPLLQVEVRNPNGTLVESYGADRVIVSPRSSGAVTLPLVEKKPEEKTKIILVPVPQQRPTQQPIPERLRSLKGSTHIGW